MKLHSLSLQAFGPFANKETIDFSELGENPLYLIDGPTGSGKSSILHGICYALYGETTDADRKSLGLRCDHAKEDLLTELTLEFSIREERYRITRTPTQMRPNKRGSGETEQKAEAHLCRVKPDGEEETLVPKKVKDADQRIKEIIGLSAEQFLQVMVLPQGKFRELLVAKSDVRQKILSTLFQTEVYKQIEERLKLKSADIEQQNKAFEKSKEDALADVAMADVDALVNSIQSSTTLTAAAEQKKEQAAASLQKAATTLQNAKTLANNFANLEQKKTEQAEHLQQEEPISITKAVIQRAEKAAGIMPTWQNLQRLNNDLISKQAEVEQAVADQLSADEKVTLTAKVLKEASEAYKQRDGLKAQEVKLQGYQQKLASYQQFKDAAVAADKHYQNALENKQNTFNKSEAINQQIATLSSLTESLTNETANKATIVEQKLKANALLENRVKLAKLEAELETIKKDQQQAQDEVNNLKVAHQQAEKEANRTEMHWFANQAAVLALKLEEDQPCVVCGSLEHPNLAVFEEGSSETSQESVDQARSVESATLTNHNKANFKLEKAQHLVAEALKRIDELTSTLGRQAAMSVDEAQQAFDQLSQQLTAIEEKELKLAQAKQEHKDKEADKQPIMAALQVIEDSLPPLNAAKATANSQLQSAHDDLPEQYRDADLLDKTINDTGAQIKTIEGNQQSAEQAQASALQQQARVQSQHKLLTKDANSLSERQSKQEAQWLKALADSSFATQQAYEDAYLEEQELKAIKAEVTTYDDIKKTLKAELDLLSKQLKDKKQPQLDTLQQERQNLTEAFNQTESIWIEVKQQKTRLEDTQKKINRIDKLQESIKKQYEVIGALSKAASGRGNVRVSLERFVLGNLLDSVLSIASQRLHIMSKGQYRLIRQNEEAQKRNTTAGLDLAIDDAHTGKTRPVATLSGGESFMASLALALALSDVVQERSGGIQLDTLFVDEGFGTLDQETLQLAINILVDLQSTGRSIGIISHVSELKEQMAQRIEVTCSRSGSSIKIIA